ncbi:hypothetical protein [Lignipirellula cremea]|uniref:Uncharacterized protein n=1 Tax=Lignipirellula cremea TaxID=2528010 RepID=A0A518DQS5_9BACT|nr:hypothetical protein [Lignipirellula cremea]QDU94193.1 hypothetical protein Pla8534_19810 [Lignipirellula cremea]
MKYAVSLSLVGQLLLSTLAWACPFCGPPPGTINDDIQKNDVAVIAVLVKQAAADTPLTLEDEVPPCVFKVSTVLRGDAVKVGQEIEVYYYGSGKRTGEKPPSFMLLGIDDESKIVWGSPQRLSEEAIAYLAELPKLPAEGAKRLKFFQDYLENGDEMLARDAYDEFAKAPYEDIVDLGPDMNRKQLLHWISSDETPSTRRRLYFTLLGVCGQPEDVAILEEMLQSADRSDRTGLDALIACYLKLKGAAGLPLVEKQFLADKSAEYVDIYSAVMAIRFVGNELDVVPRPRLVEAFRLLLNRPALADLVVPDLARWEDWESMPKLVELFKNADDDTIWIREPIIKFLMACPLPAADKELDALRKIDPKAFQRVEQISPFGPPVVEKAS